ncbi:2-succinyl-6-hydroxy-2, 4-cyclohexadiene-1-carboxylate synthase [Pseudomonas sp. MM227]|uniref:alpha/beta fold hydrolase n=1 Tax=Pseudomonas sp. MM227 TaxID=3019968 RepID=UPI00221EC3C0|nr:alpha/beta hydrolase [Pseudomonas sp. MM227]CAI3787691.1 2-succinyl-6-hydroxy-2, 4-cyclohexadiene-1-carboxylate synthase [Pseudomonas sp. MM227]
MTAPVREIRLSLPHIELAAQVYGPEDGRPVLALHGWLDNANSFARLAPKLAGLRIVALDLAGHGHSGHRPVGAGYALWDYAHDVLQAADQLGWQRFSLLGHSLGGIVATLLASALPERIERLALIDGVIPPLGAAEEGPQRLGEALHAQQALGHKRKSVYADIDRAVLARMQGRIAVSHEAAELLAARGLERVAGGFSWRSDSRLTLPSPVRLSEDQALAYVQAIRCPSLLILAEQGLLVKNTALLARLGLPLQALPGGHHLHLNDDTGARLVADCFNRFFAIP